MLNGSDVTAAIIPAAKGAESGRRFGGWAGNTLRILRFLLVEGRIVRDPVILVALAASIGRAGLIFAINETARASGAPVWQLALLLGSAALFLAATYFARLRAHILIVDLTRRLRLRLSHLLLSARADFLQEQDRGQVYAALTLSVDDTSGATINVIESIEAVLLIAIAVPYLFWISWGAGLATCAAISVGVIGYVVFEAPARRYLIRANRAAAALCDRVDDMLSGWKELRLSAPRRSDLERDYAASLAEMSDSRIRSERLFTASHVAAQGAVIILLLMVVVPIPFLPGSESQTLFQVLTVILLTYGPIEMIFTALPRLSRAEAGHARLMQVAAALEDARATDAGREAGTIRRGFRRIELAGVTAHLRDPAVNASDERGFYLGPVDLTLVPGETVFICGPNGSGKSTLLDIITGLRQPEGGRLVWDGEPVGEDRLPEYRALFSSVFSRFHLFEKPYGLDAADRAVLTAAIAELGLERRVVVTGDRFSTLSLSAGQRRRLALAVALAESRPIIVLDEFAADQDPDYRRFFYDVLLPRLSAKGHLVIAVTHDDSQFSKCDRLLRLETGRVVPERRSAEAV